MEVVPAWLTNNARGRPTFARGETLESLRAGAESAEDLRVAVTSLLIQENHATRCKGLTTDFLSFLRHESERGEARQRSLGEGLARFGAHLLMTRPTIGRSSTIRTYLVGASRCWPSAMRTPEVRQFLGGLEMVSPVMPELACVTLARTYDAARLNRWLVEMAGSQGGYAIALATGLMAGLRMRECARLLMRHGANAFSVAPDGEVKWSESASTKTNMRGKSFLADRSAWVPEEVVPRLRQLHLPWRVSEKDAARVVSETAASMARAGLPRDVRVFRRVLARRIHDQTVRRGESEEGALALVRHALGHRPGSHTTVRYLGSPLSTAGHQRLRMAQRSAMDAKTLEREAGPHE
jgi:hypothetical protein